MNDKRRKNELEGQTSSTGLTRARGKTSSDAPMFKVGGRLVALDQGTTISTERPEVDIAFVFDTTGSMLDKRDGLVLSMSTFVDDLARLSLDWRTTVVPFGDLTVPGDRIDGRLPFVYGIEDSKAQLKAMPQFSGGGNTGESAIEAMDAALAKQWRPRAVKVIVLLTDDYALGADQRADEILGRLLSSETLCFTAGLDTPYYRSWSERSGGKWVPIGVRMDTSAILTLFRRLVRDIAETASNVHRLGRGSVRKYLELTRGKDT